MTKRFNGDEFLLESLLGKPLNEAKELAGFSGFRTRVTRVDGESYMITCDLKADRINLHLESGKVVKTSIG
jgi:hypothetical protein